VPVASFGDISVETDVQGTEVVLTGEIDLAAVRQAADAVEGIMCAPPSRLDIDASSVTFIDSSGVATLIKLYAVTTGAGGTVRLHRPSPPVVRVLNICGLLDTFGVRRETVAVPPG
jgi:anti-anti-sigma factor